MLSALPSSDWRAYTQAGMNRSIGANKQVRILLKSVWAP
jgi:hypothetical protein